MPAAGLGWGGVHDAGEKGGRGGQGGDEIRGLGPGPDAHLHGVELAVARDEVGGVPEQAFADVGHDLRDVPVHPGNRDRGPLPVRRRAQESAALVGRSRQCGPVHGGVLSGVRVGEFADANEYKVLLVPFGARRR